MNLQRTIRNLACGLTLTVLCSVGSVAQAQLAFNVKFIPVPAGAAYIELSLSDGDVASLGTPDTNNSVLINNFLFDGGATGAILPPTLGNASGDIATSVNLADGDAGGVADLAQAFTAGGFLSFDVHMTTNVDGGGTPDVFLVRLLDINQQYLETTDPSQSNSFVTVMVGQGGPTAFGPVNGAPAPIITPLGSDVPEPGTYALLGGLATPGLMLLRRRRA